MQSPVFIELRRSNILIGSVGLMHCAAAVVFFFLPWPLPLRIVLPGALAISLVYALRPPRIVSLRLHGNGDLECALSDGTLRPAILLPDTTVFSWLVVLRLRVEDEKGTISLPLFPDHMSREEFRLLRLCLRWNSRNEPGRHGARQDTSSSSKI
ncbi:hypothetical protein FACS189475_08830 [Betaproteobacteria bacterium]|nr:hypothetical protein FACS189475_08830 [Betaproteobacteria bacterium]